MKKRILYGIWGCLYISCAALSAFITEPDGLQLFTLVVLSLLFFVPPVLLLVDAHLQGDKKTLLTLRWISGLSLLLTLLLLVANVAAALGSDTLGNILYGVLLLVSVPMICIRNWFVSMFLWACVFFTALHRSKVTGNS